MRSDVCLILEGTYPYVAGGVSTWVAQILEAMPEISFSILFIGPKRDMPRKLKYAIPPNVTLIEEVFVHDYQLTETEPPTRGYLRPADWDVIDRSQRALTQGTALDMPALLATLDRFPDPQTCLQTLAFSETAWELVRAQYVELAPPGTSFLDFFWTHRFINIPVFGLLTARIPHACIYHSASTGYAGLLGAKAHAIGQAPLLLSEHGIYTRERRIEIFNADWIHGPAGPQASLDMRRAQNFLKDWWGRFFLALSRTTYDAAAKICSLFDANRRDQIADGAPAEKMEIIPNGIDLGRYTQTTSPPRTPGEPFRIAFVGRVTSIKDIKTLVRAMDLLRVRLENFELMMLGPLDEEPEYVKECEDLIASLQLENHICFYGRVNVGEYLDRIDVMILTSISEGLPFVILEANCAGIPVVATHVGACSELLNGRTPEDKALGPSGLITPVATPAATAAALERLARNPGLMAEMGEAGRRRVRQFYGIHDVMHSYRRLYETLLYAEPVESQET